MNTEKIKTLEQIHIALEEVEKARAVPGLSRDQKGDLEIASVKLWNMEQAIIRKIGDELVKTLKADSKALNDLASKIKKSAASLAGVADAVENASKVVEGLINIILAVAGSGLV